MHIQLNVDELCDDDRFDVTLIVPEDYEAISNMPILSQYVENDLKVETPILHLFLFCFLMLCFNSESAF